MVFGRLVRRALARLGYTLVHESMVSRFAAERAPHLRSSEQDVAVYRADIERDTDFMDLYELCVPFTMTSVERMYSLYKCVRFIVQAGIPGAIVECGVWRGGSMMLVAHTLMAQGDAMRPLFLYDTFKGLPKPSSEDVDHTGAPAEAEWRASQRETHNEWCYASFDEVQANMASTGYDPAHIRYVQGMVEDTVPGVLPESVALLRLDTDFYSSTKHEMTHLYPLLIQGGFLVIDDYGHWQGQRKAIDEHFAASREAMMLHRVDYTCRIGQKGLPHRGGL